MHDIEKLHPGHRSFYYTLTILTDNPVKSSVSCFTASGNDTIRPRCIQDWSQWPILRSYFTLWLSTNMQCSSCGFCHCSMPQWYMVEASRSWFRIGQTTEELANTGLPRKKFAFRWLARLSGVSTIVIRPGHSAGNTRRALATCSLGALSFELDSIQ